MTALCGGGASQLKPGQAGTNAVAGTLITEGLLSLGPWLAPAAALIDGFLVESSTQCGSDPPAMPTWDASDLEILALGLLAPTAQQTLNKIHNLLLNYAWYLWCECSSVATPPPPPPSSQPTGTNTTSGQTNQPCFTGSYDGVPATLPVGFLIPPSSVVTGAVLPSDGRVATWVEGGTNNVQVLGMPQNVSVVKYQGTNTYGVNGNPTNSNLSLWFRYFDANLNLLRTDPLDHRTNTIDLSVASQLTPPAGTQYWLASDTNVNTSGAAAGRVTIQTQVFCNGGQPGALEDCCPPDPALQLGINTIIQFVQQILANSSGTPSTGWADGASHPGLSGTGSFQLGTNVTGVRANFTTIPPNIRVTPGTPTFYWDLGFVTPVAVDVPLRSLRTVFAAQAMSLPTQTTGIDYTFPVGAVVTLTELHPA